MRKRLTAWLAAWIAALGLLACPAATAADGEDELKAAVVLSFLRYSAWPAAQKPGDSVTVSVLGRSSLVQALRGALAGKSVNNRPVRVVDARADSACPQVFYIASEKTAEIQKGLQTAHACGALTIGETDRFLELGGSVNLLVVDGKMRFEVDLVAVERAGIQISSTLLRYGQVRGRPPA